MILPDTTGSAATVVAPPPAPFPPYRAPLWLPGGHLQTIYPATLVRRAEVHYRRERWQTPDGDFVDVDFVDGQPDKPLLVLFHGMEGSSNSHYARAIMAHVQALGWSGAIPHFRSCSGEINHAARFYHCADYEEADWVLRRLHEATEPTPKTPSEAPPILEATPRLGATPMLGATPILEATPRLGAQASVPASITTSCRRHIYAVGVSLGGSVLLHWLAKSEGAAAGLVQAAATVCAPLDVTAGGHALSRKTNWLYTQQFLKTLKPKALAKLAQHPGLFDGEAVRHCRTIHDFDHLVTAPLHGFSSVEAYYEAASAKYLLDDIRVPTLVLNTLNDPFIPAESLPKTSTSDARSTDSCADKGNSNAAGVTLEYWETGGHLGFTEGPPPGKHNWLPRRLEHWFT